MLKHLAIPLCLTASVALIIFAYNRKKDNDGITDKEEQKQNGKANTSTRSVSEPSAKDEIRKDMPSHLYREIVKEKRRNEKIKFLAMKSPAYDNIRMLDPDGTLLCKISRKKAKWYVQRDLALWTADVDGEIQLTFEPKNRSNNDEDGKFTKSDKINQCVACSETEFLMRHHVVPYAYRSLFPFHFKAHLSHDVVVLCPKCHFHAERECQLRMKETEEKLRKPWHKPQYEMNRDLQHIRSCALALLKWKDRIPVEKQREHEVKIRDHLNLKDWSEPLTKEQLQLATDVNYRPENKDYFSGPELVVQSLGGDDEEKITQFIREWRRHFLHTVRPSFLPDHWNVDSACMNDRTK